MSATTLLEADQKFAAALSELRRDHYGKFASWLNAALASEPTETAKTVPERISLIRRQFTEDFVNLKAPEIIDALNPQAKQNIIDQLRAFENRRERQPSYGLRLNADGLWRPGVLRTMLGAAIGAAAALLLFSLQASGPQALVTTQQPVAQQSVTPDPAAPAAISPVPPVPKTDSNATSNPPVGTAAPPQATTPPETVAPPQRERDDIEQSTLLIIVGALGAAFGGFVTNCPPFRVLLARFGFQSNIFRRTGMAGLAFVLRRYIFALAIGALALATVALAGVLFSGPKPWWTVLFGLAAIFMIVLARYGMPSSAASEREAMRQSAIDALNQQLSVDASVWSALAAALVVRSTVTARVEPKLDQIRSIIIARRNQNEPADGILRIVEQELRLDPGGAPTTRVAPSVFTWKPEHAEQYDTVGIVGIGDMVNVLAAPQVKTDANGVTEVFQKGKVTRKR